MKKKGFTLVELLAVIAILAILVIVAMPNVLGMFNQAKVNSFVTEVQKIMDTATTTFTKDALLNSGKTVYYSSTENATLGTKKLDMSGNEKNYFIEMNRNGEFKRVVVYDSNYCYDISSSTLGNGKIDGTKTKVIYEDIDKTTVVASDVWEAGNDSVIATIDSGSYKINGCEGVITVEGKTSNSGDQYIGEEELTVNQIYSYGDYNYKYQKFTVNGTQYGWTVTLNEEITDRNQTTYGEILQSINGKPILSLNATFKDCVNMVESPKIPNTVLILASTYLGCTSLKNAPALPSNLYSMVSAFQGCTSLEHAPLIPETVYILQRTFDGCTSLKTAPKIHSNAKIINGLFQNCTSLTGTITIDSIPAQASGVFTNVDFKNQNITLTGTSPYLDTFGKSGKNYCEECNGICSLHNGTCSGTCLDSHMITFTIQGVEYQAEKNMTWQNWISSSYNINSVCMINPQIGVLCNGIRIRSPEGIAVSPSRIISSGEVYL